VLPSPPIYASSTRHDLLGTIVEVAHPDLYADMPHLDTVLGDLQRPSLCLNSPQQSCSRPQALSLIVGRTLNNQEVIINPPKKLWFYVRMGA